MKKNNNLVLFSRHPSHSPLRKVEFNLPVLTCMRLGSITKGKVKYSCEINSPESIKISANKRLMKQKFSEVDVKTADWFLYNNETGNLNKVIGPILEDGRPIVQKVELPYPIIAKNIYGSRGTGNYKLNNEQELNDWLKSRTGKLDNYIFEAFFKKGREYRLHVTVQGCFYACRKMLKKDAEETWHRHDENCVWIKEENPLFDKPVNWDIIVADCVKALQAIGADVLAFDVKVQTSKDKKENVRTNPNYILIESASAPSFGEVTIQKYIEIIPKIVNYKLNPPINPKPTVVVEPKPFILKDFKLPKQQVSNVWYNVLDKDKKVYEKYNYLTFGATCYNSLTYSPIPNEIQYIHTIIKKLYCGYDLEFVEKYIAFLNSLGFLVEFENKEDSYDFLVDLSKYNENKILLQSTLFLVRYLWHDKLDCFPHIIMKLLEEGEDGFIAIQKCHNMDLYRPYMTKFYRGYGGNSNHSLLTMDNRVSFFTKQEFELKMQNNFTSFRKNAGVSFSYFWTK